MIPARYGASLLFFVILAMVFSGCGDDSGVLDSGVPDGALDSGTPDAPPDSADLPDARSDTGSTGDTGSSVDAAMDTAVADSGSSGCPAPSDLPPSSAGYACADVDDVGLRLLRMQDTSSGNGFYAKTSETLGWDDLALRVNLESAGVYPCAAGTVEFTFQTGVGTATPRQWVANSPDTCEIEVTRAALRGGDVYEGTFRSTVITGSFRGVHQ